MARPFSAATWVFHPYSLPLARPYVWAKGTQTRRLGLFVACTIDGATGWGEVAPPPHLMVDPRLLATQAHRAVRESAVEEAPPRLRCGLMGAWLDAHARLASAPLGSFVATSLGIQAPTREDVPTNALVAAEAPEQAAQSARQAMAEGFRTIKVKSGGDAAHDVARMSAIRDAVGSQVALRLDANGAYAPAEALAAMRNLEPLDLEYVEQPVLAAHRATIVRLLQDSPVPVALDESVTSWQDVAPFIAHGPILIIKPQRLGGIDRTIGLAWRARAEGIDCVVTNSLETAVGRAHALHAAAAMPEPLGACGLATEAFLASDCAQLRSHGGRLALPSGPGLGLDPEVPIAASVGQ